MLSCIINLDTRPQRTTMEAHNMGVTCSDLLVGNVVNKRRFFQGFDAEFIAYIDVHEPVPEDALRELNRLCDCVVLRKHSKKYRGADPFNGFNDVNYIQSLNQARGEIVAHFDMDSVAFARDKSATEEWLAHLDTHRFVSYCSPCSPRPVDDPSFGKHSWVSTRCFATKREYLKLDELEAAIREPKTAYEKYGYPPRQLGWTEHLISLINEDSVIYPKRRDDSILLWCWGSYRNGLMEKLNAMPFDEIAARVQKCGSICYPCDVTGLEC